MFAIRRDASKAALVHLVARLKAQGVTHIDCQQETAHMASLGARPVSRTAFLALLKAAGAAEISAQKNNISRKSAEA
jgi:leucyl/phenylalanyl-tRNA--protein transferase